jgi:hypothetical protein
MSHTLVVRVRSGCEITGLVSVETLIDFRLKVINTAQADVLSLKPIAGKGSSVRESPYLNADGGRFSFKSFGRNRSTPVVADAFRVLPQAKIFQLLNANWKLDQEIWRGHHDPLASSSYPISGKFESIHEGFSNSLSL